MTRDLRLDTIRGFLLVLMFVNHMGPPVKDYAGELFGFVSALEGFVFVSGLVAGLVYGKTAVKTDWPSLRRRVFRRARDLYLFQIATFLSVAGMVLISPALAKTWHVNLEFVIRSPLASLGWGTLLLYQPPLFDILPMYALFLLITPWVLWGFRKNQAPWVLGISFLVWALSQPQVFDYWSWLHIGLSPYLPINLGTFVYPCWQFLFVIGLYLGFQRQKKGSLSIPVHFSLALLALGLALVCLAMRYKIIPSAYPGFDFWGFSDKSFFGPMRLINFFSLAYLVTLIGLVAPRLLTERWLAFLGQHSLQVFAFHVLLVYAVMGLYAPITERGWIPVILANLLLLSLLTLPAWLHVKYRISEGDWKKFIFSLSPFPPDTGKA